MQNGEIHGIAKLFSLGTLLALALFSFSGCKPAEETETGQAKPPEQNNALEQKSPTGKQTPTPKETTPPEATSPPAPTSPPEEIDLS